MINNNDDFIIDSVSHNSEIVNSNTITEISNSINTNINDIQHDVDHLNSSIDSLNNYCVELDNKTKIAMSDIDSKYSNAYNKIRKAISDIEIKLYNLNISVNNLDTMYDKLKFKIADLNDKHKHLYSLHNSDILHLTSYIESISNSAVHRDSSKQCNSKIYIGDIMIRSDKHFNKFTIWILKKLFNISIINLIRREQDT